MFRTLPALLMLLPVVGAMLGVPNEARAEGAEDLQIMEELLPETRVYVDILDATIERIQFTASHPAEMYDPNGNYMRAVLDGELIVPTAGEGAYSFRFGLLTDAWDFEVAGRNGGRVWSPDWRFNAGTFRAMDALNRSFYALVDGGQVGHDGLVELKAEGLAGYVFRLAANRSGLPRTDGRSVPVAGQVFNAEMPIYLEPPERALLNPVDPSFSGLSASSPVGTCDTLVPGTNEVTFNFTSNVNGTVHILCDINQDGVFDMVDDGDVHLIREAFEGSNQVVWNGNDNEGLPVATGAYQCLLRLTVGEFHYVGYDIETSYPGFRLYEYQNGGTRRGLSMYWNDVDVQANDINMPNNVPGRVSSGADGVDPGSYASAADPLTNARAWGAFRTGSKGDSAWMDTYAWIASVDSTIFDVNVADGTGDIDGDGLTDIVEDCESGTDKTKPDTDEDGIGDKREWERMPTDPLDPDSDDDCLLDGEEVPAEGQPYDSDDDDIVDPLDPDDDGDGILTILEMCELPNDLPTDRNFDESLENGDEAPNHLDLDSDGDLWSDSREGIGDRDGDGNADFLDPDTVGFGIFDPQGGYYAGGCAQGPLPTRAAVAGLALLLLRRRRG
jgi:hypothetical protein